MAVIKADTTSGQTMFGGRSRLSCKTFDNKCTICGARERITILMDDGHDAKSARLTQKAEANHHPVTEEIFVRPGRSVFRIWHRSYIFGLAISGHMRWRRVRIE